jgi:hypothetical protein
LTGSTADPDRSRVDPGVIWDLFVIDSNSTVGGLGIASRHRCRIDRTGGHRSIPIRQWIIARPAVIPHVIKG